MVVVYHRKSIIDKPKSRYRPIICKEKQKRGAVL